MPDTSCPTRSGPHACLHKLNDRGEHEGPCEAQAAEYAAQTVFVMKNGWWWDACPKHGRTEHRLDNGGKCIECHKLEGKVT